MLVNGSKADLLLLLLYVLHLKELHLHTLCNFYLHLPNYILVLSNLALRDMYGKCLHSEQKRRRSCVPEFFLGCGELLVFRDFLCFPSSLIVHMCEAGVQDTGASR